MEAMTEMELSSPHPSIPLSPSLPSGLYYLKQNSWLGVQQLSISTYPRPWRPQNWASPNVLRWGQPAGSLLIQRVQTQRPSAQGKDLLGPVRTKSLVGVCGPHPPASPHCPEHGDVTTFSSGAGGPPWEASCSCPEPLGTSQHPAHRRPTDSRQR